MRKVIAIGLLVSALGGCSSGNDDAARLNVHGSADNTLYVDKFERAYFSQTDTGATDLVLLTGNGPSTPLPDEGAVTGGPAVRQVVHIKVLWTPTHTIRVDSPSAANAMIDWDVIQDAQNRVSYSGSCWANVDVDGDAATVDLRNADVSVRKVMGQVQDPLRHARLDGKFSATRSDANVRAYMTDLAALAHPAATASLAPAGPVAP